MIGSKIGEQGQTIHNDLFGRSGAEWLSIAEPDCPFCTRARIILNSFLCSDADL
jgi:hypothetical protein